MGLQEMSISLGYQSEEAGATTFLPFSLEINPRASRLQLHSKAAPNFGTALSRPILEPSIHPQHRIIPILPPRWKTRCFPSLTDMKGTLVQVLIDQYLSVPSCGSKPICFLTTHCTETPLSLSYRCQAQNAEHTGVNKHSPQCEPPAVFQRDGWLGLRLSGPQDKRA